jgi:DNA repair ATPase RecN
MDVRFPGKLTVITGETGAGKSIFLEALALVLGKRADTASLQNKNKKCVIEAEFDAGKLDLKEFFQREELDEEKLPVLLNLKYQAIADAVRILGGVERIRDTFLGFQKCLYSV